MATHIIRLLFLTLFVPTFLIDQNEALLSNYELIDPIDLKYKFPLEIDSILSNSGNPPYQYTGTLFSLIGLEHEAFENFYGRYPSRKPMNDSLFEEFNNKFYPVNAKEYIIQRAKNEQILIINEAHHKGKHRVFTESLLKDLYQLGYRHLGLEALANRSGYTDTLLNERKYPTSKSGFYIVEPNFGNLVRSALNIGFKVFPYEGAGNNKEREISQAKNIQNYIEAHPGEKTLIHCGYQHAMEGDLKNKWEKAMAGRVLEYTGINPLTINQTQFDNRWESSYLNPLSQRLNIESPTVFISEDSLSYLGETDNNGYDIYVFHEQSKYEDGRPIWRKKEGNRIVSIRTDSIEFNEPFLLMAFKNSENIEEAIPEDIVFIDPLNKHESVYFILSDKEYIFLAQKQKGKAIRFKAKIP